MKVTIKGKEYDFEFDSVWGALYLYEELMGEKLPFDPRKAACLHMMFYCILARANKGFDMKIEDFIMSLNDVRMTLAMREYYFNRMEQLSGISSDVAEAEFDKKKE